MGRAGLAQEEGGAEVLRVVWRELQALPDLHDEVVRDRMDTTQEAVAAWLRRQAGSLMVDDPEAMAAVLLSGVRVYRVTEALLGRPPGGVAEERYLRAWTALVTRGMVGGESSEEPAA